MVAAAAGRYASRLAGDGFLVVFGSVGQTQQTPIGQSSACVAAARRTMHGLWCQAMCTARVQVVQAQGPTTAVSLSCAGDQRPGSSPPQFTAMCHERVASLLSRGCRERGAN